MRGMFLVLINLVMSLIMFTRKGKSIFCEWGGTGFCSKLCSHTISQGLLVWGMVKRGCSFDLRGDWIFSIFGWNYCWVFWNFYFASFFCSIQEWLGICVILIWWLRVWLLGGKEFEGHVLVSVDLILSLIMFTRKGRSIFCEWGGTSFCYELCYNTITQGLLVWGLVKRGCWVAGFLRFLVEIIIGVFVKQTKGLWIYCGSAEFLPLFFKIFLLSYSNSRGDWKDGMQILLPFNLLRWGSWLRLGLPF